MSAVFQVGQSYGSRSACDSDCVFSMEIVSRTEKTAMEKTLQLLTEIAAKQTNFKTLEARESDELDFKIVPVWDLRAALLEAFEAGKNAQVSK